MSLFAIREYEVPAQTAALGASLTFTLPRDLALEAIVLEVDYTVGTVAATVAPDGQLNLIKKVTFTGAESGADQRDLISASGAGLIKRAANLVGSLDRDTLAVIGNNTTGAKKQIIYIDPRPNVDDPEKSLFLVPMGLFTNDPTLTVDIASQADLDTNASKTFALTGTVSVRVLLLRRFVDIANWRFMKWEIKENDITCADAVDPRIFNLPTPGAIPYLQGQMFSSATAIADITNNRPIQVRQLGTTIRSRRLSQAQGLGDFSRNHSQGATATNFTGLFVFDFLGDMPGATPGDFGSVLNTNELSQAGVQPTLEFNVQTGGAGCRLRLLYDRIFGDIAPLQRALSLGAKR